MANRVLPVEKTPPGLNARRPLKPRMRFQTAIFGASQKGQSIMTQEEKTEVQTQSDTPISRAQTAGRVLVQAAKDQERLGVDFSISVSAAVLFDHKALLAKCDDEGVPKRKRSKRKYNREVDCCSNYHNLVDDLEMTDDARSRLESQLSTAALYVETTVSLAREKGIKMTGAAEDHETLRDLLKSNGGIKYLSDSYLAQKKPSGRNKKPEGENHVTTSKDILKSVAANYAGHNPITTIKVPRVTGHDGDLKAVVATKAGENSLAIHTALDVPVSAMRSVLKAAKNLPVSDNPPLNQFMDLLLVGSLTMPDYKHAAVNREAGKLEMSYDFRQFLARPKENELFIAKRAWENKLVIRVSPISGLAGMPPVDAYLYTKHRREVDDFSNRFDRQRFGIETGKNEPGAKWCSKAELSVNGTDDAYPLHFHPADTHNVDITLPDLRDVEWRFSFDLTKIYIEELWDEYLYAYQAKRKTGSDEVIAFGFQKGEIGIKYGDLGKSLLPVKLPNAEHDDQVVFCVGDDFAACINAISHLDLTGDVRFDFEPLGLIRLTAPATTGTFEFFLPTTKGKSSTNTCETFYRPASKLFFTQPEELNNA